jgi:hypothetical protein
LISRVEVEPLLMSLIYSRGEEKPETFRIPLNSDA